MVIFINNWALNIHDSCPCYFYVVGDKENRFNFRKMNQRQGFDPKKQNIK